MASSNPETIASNTATNTFVNPSPESKNQGAAVPAASDSSILTPPITPEDTPSPNVTSATSIAPSSPTPAEAELTTEATLDPKTPAVAQTPAPAVASSTTVPAKSTFKFNPLAEVFVLDEKPIISNSPLAASPSTPSQPITNGQVPFNPPLVTNPGIPYQPIAHNYNQYQPRPYMNHAYVHQYQSSPFMPTFARPVSEPIRFSAPSTDEDRLVEAEKAWEREKDMRLLEASTEADRKEKLAYLNDKLIQHKAVWGVRNAKFRREEKMERAMERQSFPRL